MLGQTDWHESKLLRNLITVIMKQCWTEQCWKKHSSRTCCMISAGSSNHPKEGGMPILQCRNLNHLARTKASCSVSIQIPSFLLHSSASQASQGKLQMKRKDWLRPARSGSEQAGWEKAHQGRQTVLRRQSVREGSMFNFVVISRIFLVLP